jgi:hypothetical protein
MKLPFYSWLLVTFVDEQLSGIFVRSGSVFVFFFQANFTIFEI